MPQMQIAIVSEIKINTRHEMNISLNSTIHNLTSARDEAEE